MAKYLLMLLGRTLRSLNSGAHEPFFLAWGEGSEGAMILKFMVLRFTENRPFLKLFHQVSKLIMFKFPLSTSSSSFPLLC